MNRDLPIWTIVFVLAAGWLIYRTFTGEMAQQYVQQVDGRQVAAAPAQRVAGAAQLSVSRTIGVWVAALLTLAIFSFLYQDNPAYRFAEAVVVGVSAGYTGVVGFWTLLVPNLMHPLLPGWMQTWATPSSPPVYDHDWYIRLIPLTLGIMLLWRLSPTGSWISRWPLAFIVGWTAGARLIAYIEADFFSQISNSIIPLLVYQDGEFRFWDSFRNIVLTVSMLCALVYFYFSVEHVGVVGKISRVGIWVLMITFGFAFGFTVMGRIALLAIRFEFLFNDWLWLIDPANSRLGL